MSEHVSKAINEDMLAYQLNPAISRSKIATAVQSAYHYKYFYLDGNVEEPTDSMKFGTLAHLAILEPELFKDKFVLEKKFSGKGSVKMYEDWAAEQKPGAIILSEKEWKRINGMITSLTSDNFPHVRNLLKLPCIREHSFYFTDPVTGLECKFRPDILTECGKLIDLKTTTCSRNSKFMKDLGPNDYHISAAFYSYGYEQKFGRKPDCYIYLAVEHRPPYTPAIHVADATVIEKGEALFRYGLDLIKRCMDTGVWPGYQDGPENISLPNWEIQSEW